MTGFADKGEDYAIKWINKKQYFEDEYGTPTNEIERYLYNGVMEVLDKGGICLVSKLPYDNMSKDRFSEVVYKLNNTKKAF